MLPENFINLMHEHYDAETADALCKALIETEPEVSVRINPRKRCELALSPEVKLEPVSWCPDAYYLAERPPFTFDPLLHAGAYYVQEASSMYVAALLKYATSHSLQSSITQPLTVLDLCAAPGGKSTLLAGLLPEGSLLLSNEPLPKRSYVLAENMQKWIRMKDGKYPVQSIVTNNYPADFGAFSDCFDLLVTDVPCSGEGMFRKDEDAVRDWSIDNVMMCAQRQREILRDIWHTLKPGGLLIYSTCTFNRFEDEDNTEWISSELGGKILEQRHFLPGRDKGEGFYCAAIRKNPLPTSTISETENYLMAGNELSPCVEKVRDKALKTLRIIPEVFQCEGPIVELSYNEALQYLRCEAVRVTAPRGMVTLSYGGMLLGPGKCVGNRINNLYPKEWRIRTTHTTPWSLYERI